MSDDEWLPVDKLAPAAGVAFGLSLAMLLWGGVVLWLLW